MVQHFVTTRPELKLCQNCGALLLEGILEGLPFRVEIDPINPIGELLAILDHQPTYELDGSILRCRGAAEMARHKADQIPVLVYHRCRRPVPADQRQHHEGSPGWRGLVQLKQQYGATDVPPPF